VSKRIGYYAHRVVREFVCGNDKFAIMLRDDGIVVGVLPVFRTKKLAHKFYGRKAKLLEVWDDGRET